jgi:hypothetical protein
VAVTMMVSSLEGSISKDVARYAACTFFEKGKKVIN